LWLHSLKVAQLLRSAACLHTNQSRSYLNHLVHTHSTIYFFCGEILSLETWHNKGYLLCTSTLETGSSRIKSSTRSFLHQNSKPKIGKITEDERLQSIYLLFIRMLVKNTTSRTTTHRRTPVSITAVVATAITTTNSESQSNLFGHVTVECSGFANKLFVRNEAILKTYNSASSSFFLSFVLFFMIVRPPVFVFPQCGTRPARHALCRSVLSLLRWRWYCRMLKHLSY